MEFDPLAGCAPALRSLYLTIKDQIIKESFR